MASPSAIKAILELERRKCAADPTYFLKHHIWTKDQTDEIRPFKKFPSPETKPHIYHLVKRWQEEPRLIVPKSRRMQATWTFCALWLWDAAFHEGRLDCIVPEKEEKAGELVDRVEFMASHPANPKFGMPPGPLELGLIPPFKRKRSPHEITFEGASSQIMGLPSGADQLRQYGTSNVIYDEAAFQADLAENLGASAATSLGESEASGNIVLLSSACAGSHMEQLVFGDEREAA